VVEAAVDLYAAAFIERYERRPGRHAVLTVPGLRGVVPADEERTIQLLVTDDRAHDQLAEALASGRPAVATVFATARRCDRLLHDRTGWRSDRPSTAMVLRDLRSLPDPALPDGLVLRPVNRAAPDAQDRVPLRDAISVRDAAAAAIASDPGLTGTVDAFGDFLRELPSTVRLFAAVDEKRVVRATCGCDVFGEHARVFFVNTEPGWRRRGIGRAMTVEALRDAASSGACRAVLDATVDGASVYLGLGFEAAGRITRHSHAA
jgi:ribosomal protein S18 acetylase RimI-like enzyme